MGRPKHALPMRDGRTMIEHVVDALLGVCDDVVVVGPDDVLPTLAHVHDRRTDCGPLAGIEALLLEAAPASSKGRVEVRHYLICPCDIPLVTADLLRRLCAPTDKPITVFQVEGRDAPEPLPMRISTAALPAVQSCLDSDRRSVQALLATDDCERASASSNEVALLGNVNSPEQYQQLLHPHDDAGRHS